MLVRQNTLKQHIVHDGMQRNKSSEYEEREWCPYSSSQVKELWRSNCEHLMNDGTVGESYILVLASKQTERKCVEKKMDKPKVRRAIGKMKCGKAPGGGEIP